MQANAGASALFLIALAPPHKGWSLICLRTGSRVHTDHLLQRGGPCLLRLRPTVDAPANRARPASKTTGQRCSFVFRASTTVCLATSASANSGHADVHLAAATCEQIFGLARGLARGRWFNSGGATISDPLARAGRGPAARPSEALPKLPPDRKPVLHDFRRCLAPESRPPSRPAPVISFTPRQNLPRVVM